MAYLYDVFDNPFARKALEQVELPNLISDNLKFSVRPYQEEAFKRYIYLDKEGFDEKPKKPYHLLYNMATGSGKTLVMAGLMLYLYQKGLRNFLFFVNSNNIIQKTKDNFLNPQASKYLFSDKIVINGKEIHIKDVTNLEEADEDNINIKFTTIQQLHLDLNNTKENSLTYEDFENKKIVLIADEAHHLSAGTRSGHLLGSWENTVVKILQKNFDNILLEFTATLDYKAHEIVEKYQSKVIQKYDLKQFRNDKYSKEINLVRSLYDENDRVLQALILNLYRQELATSHDINLKPVILFKAKKTIKESEHNKENFHKLIDNLSAEMVENIKKTSTVRIVQNAFTFFEDYNLTINDIVNRLKSNFREENCISANSDKEAELNQIRLNTLEDGNNPIRAVFAVQKLNEGWDVLNLFDIVRLYEGQNTGDSGSNIGKTTLSEAQLIGRGARYFPFSLEKGQDKYTRKFDDDLSNNLKVLEELYYHTREDNRYISELKRALVQSGIYDDTQSVQLTLALKPSFKKSYFYKNGKVIFNKKIEKNYNNIKSFTDLGVNKKNIKYQLSSGLGNTEGIFENYKIVQKEEKIVEKNVKVTKIPIHITRYAISQQPFFHFDSLRQYFPNLLSLSKFIESKEYLGGLEITFRGSAMRLQQVTHFDYLKALIELLQAIESEIKQNITDYEGSRFINKSLHKVFKPKLSDSFKR